MPGFSGLLASDFDAYAPNKWKSNVFNRERLEVKQRLMELGRAAHGAMSSPDGSPLSVEPSVEHPALWNHKQVEAQHVFFFRNEGARKELDGIIDRQKSIASLIEDPTPQRNHVFAAITLTHQTLEVAIKLHPDAQVDRQNLERRCVDHFEAEKLVHHLVALGEGFRTGITPTLEPVGEATPEKLRTWLSGWASQKPAPLATPHFFYVGRQLDRAEALAKGADLVGWARETLGLLVPIYKFIAWSRDNDFVSMKEVLQKEKQQKRQKGLNKNDAVRIIRGPFAGKSGVIQEVDAKGGLKVLVGMVAIKVDVEDVTRN